MKPPETAPPKEWAAYASISLQDEPLIAWLIQQPIEGEDFYNHVRMPYTIVCAMVDKARAIGNSSSQTSAAAFFQSWRQHGNPFAAYEALESRSLPSTRNGERPSQRSLANTHQNVLTSAWDFCDRYEQQVDMMHIKYRWAMALLGQAYVNKIEEIKREDAAASNDTTHNRYGKGKVRTQAIEALLPLFSSAPTSKERDKFKRRLNRSTRWYEVAKALGWGILCLMPHDAVSPNWVEREVPVGPWNVWMTLVAKINPVAHNASKALDTWLGSEGIAGGSISDKETLYMETSEPMPATQIEEIQDSEGESEGESEEDVEPPQSQATSLPPRRSRPLTLLELCKPQE